MNWSGVGAFIFCCITCKSQKQGQCVKNDTYDITYLYKSIMQNVLFFDNNPLLEIGEMYCATTDIIAIDIISLQAYSTKQLRATQNHTEQSIKIVNGHDLNFLVVKANIFSNHDLMFYAMSDT